MSRKKRTWKESENPVPLLKNKATTKSIQISLGGGGGVPGVRTQEDPRLSTQGEGWPCPFLPPPYLIRLGGGSLGSRRPGPHLQLDRPVGDPLFVCMQ